MTIPHVNGLIKGKALEWIYHYYEKRLLAEVKNGEMPRHVGMILDGNRRWARGVGLQEFLGHEYGFAKLKEVLRWCWQLGISTVTVYALSTENFQRSKAELGELFRLAERGFREVLESREVHENRVQIRAIGRLDLLTDELNAIIKQAVESTKGYQERRLNIAMAYGGRAEIIDAAKEIFSQVLEGKISVSEIDEETFSRHLYTAGDPDPDLIIRTSGEERLSGFLLWQSAYAEFYFLDVFWPELRRIDFLRAIRTYQRRKRRFGK